MPVVERTIEQPHALVNLKVGRKTVRPAYVSLATRLPMLQGLLEDAQAVHGDDWQALEESYGVARHATSLAKALHLEGHPLLTSHQLCHNEEKLRFVRSAIYRSDMPSRFLVRKTARKQHMRATLMEARAGAAVLLQGARKRTYESVDDIMAACALEHFRAVVKTGDLLYQVFSNKPLRHKPMCIKPLLSFQLQIFRNSVQTRRLQSPSQENM